MSMLMLQIAMNNQEQTISLYNQLLQLIQPPVDKSLPHPNDKHTIKNSFAYGTYVDNPNQNGLAPIEFCTTTQLQDGSYNQINNTDDEKYRFIKHYYIYKKKDKNKKRISLPILYKEVSSDIVIAGWLQPSLSKNDAVSITKNNVKPAFVLLENITQCAVMDWTESNRGFWIKIDDVWYYLQEPCDYSPPETIESQAQVQWKTTAVLSCVLALHDQVLKEHPTNASKTIGKILENSSLVLESSYPNISPLLAKFELGVIANMKEAIIQHLAGCVHGCTNKCTFIKSIGKLQKPAHPMDKKAVQIWVQLISLQLNQFMWGGKTAAYITDDNISSNIQETVVSTQVSDINTIKNVKNKLCKQKRTFAENADDFVGKSPRSKKQKIDVPSIKLAVDKTPRSEKQKIDVPTIEADNTQPSKKPKIECPSIETDNTDFFDALRLKKQLANAISRIPYIQCNVPMDAWNEKTTWETIAENNKKNVKLEIVETLKGGQMSEEEREKEENEKAAAFFDHIMGANNKVQMEELIMAIYAMINSAGSSSYYALLFRHQNGSTEKRPVTFIFNDKMDDAMQVLDRRIGGKKSLEQTTAMYLLANILLLMASCIGTRVKNKKALEKLNTLANVDWTAKLHQVHTRIKALHENSLPVPTFLQSSFETATAKLAGIDGSMDRPLAISPFKQISTKAIQPVAEVERKIPRKQSTVKSFAVDDKSHQQASLERTNPSTFNMLNTSTLIKKMGVEIKNEPTKNKWLPPPSQTTDSESQGDPWESKNMCGWGDVQKIAREVMETSSNLKHSH